MTYHEASKTSQTEARATSDWTPTLARIEQLEAEVERLRAERARRAMGARYVECPPYSPVVCTECGCAVFRTAAHDEWHAAQERAEATLAALGGDGDE